MATRRLVDRLRVQPGTPAGLDGRDPGDRLGFPGQREGLERLEELVGELGIVRAYEEVIGETSTDWAPWHVVPADHNWVRNLAVAELVVDALRRLDPQIPGPDPALPESALS